MDWHTAAESTRYGVVAFAVLDGDRWTFEDVASAAPVQAKITVALTALESLYGDTADGALLYWRVVTTDGECVVEASGG